MRVFEFSTQSQPDAGARLFGVEDAPPSEALTDTPAANLIGLHLKRPLKVIQRRPDVRFERTFRPGQLTLIPAHAETTCTTNGPTSFLHLYVGAGLLASAIDLPLTLPGRELFEDRVVGSQLLHMARVASLPGPNTALEIETCALEIWARLARKAPPRSRGGLSAAALARVTAMLHDLGETPNIGELASAVGLSPRHFARLFKVSTGKAPHVYVRDLRIERAKALLRDRKLRIVDVSLAVGFGNPSHFAHTFRQVTGLTPLEYRASTSGRALAN